MLSDSIESAHDSREKSYTPGFGESAADSMKPEGASSGFASASARVQVFLRSQKICI